MEGRTSVSLQTFDDLFPLAAALCIMSESCDS